MPPEEREKRKKIVAMKVKRIKNVDE